MRSAQNVPPHRLGPALVSETSSAFLPMPTPGTDSQKESRCSDVLVISLGV